MTHYDLVVIGGGPAGLSAAVAAAQHGVRVCLIDQQDRLGGQLIKQTHKFFGSRDQHAGTRGIHIATKIGALIESLDTGSVLLGSTVLGCYEDRVLTIDHRGKYTKVRFDTLVIATGASERMLLFPNNDLPGVYGAGAVQTLMNVEGVKPGSTVVMVGAGNIGLIVSYQLRQAGVSVIAVVEASPVIGGYAVHASKIRRLGIPILTSHSIKEAHGDDHVQGVTIWQLDSAWRGIPGTERYITCDTICLAVGLSPLTEILWQSGCQMRWVKELGGHVPLTGEDMQTSVPGVFACGDCAGVEEASSAMITGRLAGLGAARAIGRCADYTQESARALAELESLRSGPTGQKIRAGLASLRGEGR